MAPENRAVAEAGRNTYAARVAVMCEKLEEAGFAPKAARRLAVLCVSALQGALIQARVDLSGAPIESTADELGKLLEAHDLYAKYRSFL